MSSSALTDGPSSSYMLCASASRAAVRDSGAPAGTLELLRSASRAVPQPAEVEQACPEHTRYAAGQGQHSWQTCPPPEEVTAASTPWLLPSSDAAPTYPHPPGHLLLAMLTGSWLGDRCTALPRPVISPLAASVGTCFDFSCIAGVNPG